MDTLLATAHALAWAVHLGGALTMHWVLRYAQREMPGSQVGIVCKRSGGRYRWFALVALGVVGVTGVLMLATTSDTEFAARPGSPSLSLADSYGRTMLALSVTWVMLVVAVAAMAFWLHPAQSKRSRPNMTHEQIQAERQRIGQAIQRMDRVLRFELIAGLGAVAIGASLHQGGLF